MININNYSLSNLHILVTNSNTSFGMSTAKSLVNLDATLYILDTDNNNELIAYVNSINGNINETSIKNLKNIDVLVNIPIDNKIFSSNDKKFLYKQTMVICKKMRKTGGGKVINISHFITKDYENQNLVSNILHKHNVVALTDTISTLYKEHKITSNSIIMAFDNSSTIDNISYDGVITLICYLSSKSAVGINNSSIKIKIKNKDS